MRDVNDNWLGKPFDPKDYDKYTVESFIALERDFKFLKLRLLPENYGIDVLAYLTEEDRENWINPIASIELEVSRNENWGKNGYPDNRNFVRLLLRKIRFLREENVVSYYSLYNHDYTDVSLVPFSKLKGYQPILGKTRWSEDGFMDVDKPDVSFGTKNLEQFILRHLLEMTNDFFKGFFGEYLLDVDSIKDYVRFAEMNIDIIRRAAGGVNGIHKSQHMTNIDIKRQEVMSENIDIRKKAKMFEEWLKVMRDEFLESMRLERERLEEEKIIIQVIEKEIFEQLIVKDKEDTFNEYGKRIEKINLTSI